MNIYPDEARSFVRFTDARIPNHEWLLRLPEYGYSNKIVTGVQWDVVEEGSHLRFSWQPPEGEAEEIGIEYETEITAVADEMEFTVKRTNISSSNWTDREVGSLFCLMSRDAPSFHDIDGVRSYALKDEIFQSVNQLVDSRFAHHRMCVFPVRTSPDAEPDNPCERLMAKISIDAEWVLGIATDIAGWLSCNQQPKTSCIHSNPRWGEVEPGGEATARGKVYLVEDIDILKSRYESDFKA